MERQRIRVGPPGSRRILNRSSYWMQAAASPPLVPLSGAAEADVAVIGSGIVGVSTAWELAPVGRCPAHRRVRHAADKHGDDAARRYAASQSAGLRHAPEVADTAFEVRMNTAL